MKILLDTHILLWTLTKDAKLSPKVHEYLNRNDTTFFYSVISIWEIAIKHIKNPDKMPVSPRQLTLYCDVANFYKLRLELGHVYTLETLLNSDKHRDPFDRMLLAQAKAENMKLLTHDDLLNDYDESCVFIV